MELFDHLEIEFSSVFATSSCNLGEWGPVRIESLENFLTNGVVLIVGFFKLTKP